MEAMTVHLVDAMLSVLFCLFFGLFFSNFQDLGSTVSEHCSARVSRAGLSTKQATEPYSDDLLNRTRNPLRTVLGQRDSP